MPRHKRYPWVQHFIDGRGHARLYFRKPGFPRIPLPGPYGAQEFLVAYYAALAGNPDEIGSSRTIPRSMNALVVSYYASAGFKSLRPTTARVYRNILERFREEHGDKSAAGMKARNVRNLMAEKAATPDAANRLLGLLSILMEHAIAAGWREDNPAFGVKRLRHRQAGFATWGELDIASFRGQYPLGTRERLVLELALGTAQRRGDLVRLGWRHVVNGAIVVKQSKTGATVTVPIVRELKVALDLCPRDCLTFIASAGGRPLGAASLGNEFREWLRKAGLPDRLSLHGLRKAAARRLAEAGCTAHEIAAITGHKTLSEIERYCRDAEKARLAVSGMGKVVAMLGKKEHS
ncbi:MAG: tyrosine-type recombinase/integrase [Methylocella sp.]